MCPMEASGQLFGAPLPCQDNADGDNGTDGGGATGTDLETRRRQKNDDYDHMDEFIDDSGLLGRLNGVLMAGVLHMQRG